MYIESVGSAANRWKATVIVAILAILLTGCATQSKQQKANTGLKNMVKVANEYYTRGVLSSAEGEYRKITKKYPKYYDAWLKLGNIYTRTAQLEAAVLAYENCLELKPEEMRCWNNLAVARLKQSLDTLQQGRSRMIEGSADHATLESFYDRLVDVLSEN